jgi:hypothetical protein
VLQRPIEITTQRRLSIYSPHEKGRVASTARIATRYASLITNSVDPKPRPLHPGLLADETASIGTAWWQDKEQNARSKECDFARAHGDASKFRNRNGSESSSMPVMILTNNSRVFENRR